jgi:hypothetical protein
MDHIGRTRMNMMEITGGQAEQQGMESHRVEMM